VGLRPVSDLVGSQRAVQLVLPLARASPKYPWLGQPLGRPSLSTLVPHSTYKDAFQLQRYKACSLRVRIFSTSISQHKDAAEVSSLNDQTTDVSKRDNPEELTLAFERTEKGEAAREVDLSARLKERSSSSEKGEVIRLLRLAAREWRTLTGLTNLYPY
jgi:hypothetical protein